MEKTTIEMQVVSQEVWASDGKTYEAIRLGPMGTNSMELGYYGPQHSISLFFPKGEGFSAFPMGGTVVVTFTPQESSK